MIVSCPQSSKPSDLNLHTHPLPPVYFFISLSLPSLPSYAVNLSASYHLDANMLRGPLCNGRQHSVPAKTLQLSIVLFRSETTSNFVAKKKSAIASRSLSSVRLAQKLVKMLHSTVKTASMTQTFVWMCLETAHLAPFSVGTAASACCVCVGFYFVRYTYIL